MQNIRRTVPPHVLINASDFREGIGIAVPDSSRAAVDSTLCALERWHSRWIRHNLPERERKLLFRELLLSHPKNPLVLVMRSEKPDISNG